MGLDTSRESTLWRDRALVELNRAVLYSFEQAGVKITDHHTESQRFLAHLRNEEKAGRPVPGRLELDRPADVRRATPVFHRYYARWTARFYLDRGGLEIFFLPSRRPAALVEKDRERDAGDAF